MRHSVESHTIGLASDQSGASFVSTVLLPASRHDFSLYNVCCRLYESTHIPLSVPYSVDTVASEQNSTRPLFTLNCWGAEIEQADGDSEQIWGFCRDTWGESITSSQGASQCCTGTVKVYLSVEGSKQFSLEAVSPERPSEASRQFLIVFNLCLL